MKKNKKIHQKISILLISILIFGSIFSTLANNNNVLAANQSISDDINSIDSSAYPGIKEQIQQLKNQHPNWNFKILYTNIDWNEAVNQEYVGHGNTPKCLIPSSYDNSWKCSICGPDRPYDNGSWRCASKSAIEYMMDPRGALNDADIFQFEELSSSGSDINVVRNMVSGTYLQGHEEGIYNIASNNGINAYYVVARLIQEQGAGGSELVSGKTGYYNAFNFGASGSTSAEIIANGLAYARKKGWNTLEKSIEGGIGLISNEYIKSGQNTLYLQKFNVTEKSTFAHQYQQNLAAAKSESATLRNTYLDINSFNSTHTFVIPVYRNMPQEACKTPEGVSTAATDAELVKVNVDSSLKLRVAPENNKLVKWLWKNEIVTRLEKGTTKINGTYWDKIQASNGQVGYAPRETFDYEKDYKLYLIPIKTINENNQNNGNNPNNPNNQTPSSTMKGDVNLDGKITASDYVNIKNYIMGSKGLNEQAKSNADVNSDGKITAGDYVLVKNKIMNN